MEITKKEKELNACKENNKFNEFELLTLREGLFCLRLYRPEIVSEKEFKQIDNKIKLLVENL